MTPDTLQLKRTALLAKAADLARQVTAAEGAIAVLDELLGEAIQESELEEIREGMSHFPSISRDDRAELERHAEHKEAVGMTPPPPHRMVPRVSEGL